MSYRDDMAAGIAAQVEELLEREYRRGWDDAMKYAQRGEKAESDKLDEWSRIRYPKAELADPHSGQSTLHFWSTDNVYRSNDLWSANHYTDSTHVWILFWCARLVGPES